MWKGGHSGGCINLYLLEILKLSFSSAHFPLFPILVRKGPFGESTVLHQTELKSPQKSKMRGEQRQRHAASHTAHGRAWIWILLILFP